MAGSQATALDVLSQWGELMSQEATGTLQIPACRQNPNLRICSGPPGTLPHEIPLPTFRTEIQPRHDAGHGTSNNSAVKCPICAVVATHINRCPPCQATLIRCLRNDCQAAWYPFERLIIPIAGNLARRLRGLTPAIVDEAREVATEKGMKLLYRHADCAPEKRIAEKRPLTGLLKKAMWHEIYTKVLKPILGPDRIKEYLVFGDPENDNTPFLLDTEAETLEELSFEDPVAAEVADGDAVAILQQLIVAYRDNLDEENRFVFDHWYAGAVSGAGPTQEQISSSLQQALGVDEPQYKINRRIGKFKKELAARIAAPDNEVDDETRDYAQRLFAENKRIRRSTQAPGAPSTETREPTDNSEGHDD